MSFYDTTTGLWSETDPRQPADIDSLMKQFPGTTIIKRNDGVIEVKKVVSDTEKTALSASLSVL